MQACSHIVHYHPDKMHCSFTVKFASNHIACAAFNKLKQLSSTAVWDCMQVCKAYPKAASLRGSLFEQLAHSVISMGGKFSVRSAGEAGTAGTAPVPGVCKHDVQPMT